MNITDLIQGAVASRTTRFAFELLPPLKGDGTRSVFGAIDPLMDFNPAYINVTFHREALKEDIRPDGSREWHIMRRRPGTVGISAAIRRHNFSAAGVFTSEDAKSYKPRPELFRLALAETGLAPGEVIHIGDSLSSDVGGAAPLGISALWLNLNSRPVPAGVRSISSLAEVPQILRAL